MEFAEARMKFIQTWGKLGSEWGINRTMAQVHALLLVSLKPLSTEDVMTELSISRGNANMNLRELVNWNLISKELVAGDRKEYFVAEKDIWEIAKRVARERKKREVEPVLRILKQLEHVKHAKENEEVRHFTEIMHDLNSVVGKVDKTVELMLQADENWFFKSVFKMFK